MDDEKIQQQLAKKVETLYGNFDVSSEVLEWLARTMRMEMEEAAGPRPWEGDATNTVSSPPDRPGFEEFPIVLKNQPGDVEPEYPWGTKTTSYIISRFGKKIDWSKPLAYPEGTEEKS